MPCGAVLCCVLLCFFFRTYRTTLGGIQSWREPPCPINRSFYTAVLSLLFPFFFCMFFFQMLYLYRYTVLYSNTSTALPGSIYEYVVVQCQNREHSTAYLYSTLHNAANQVLADLSTLHVRTCMLRSVCFPGAWNSWHLQCSMLAPKVLDHLLQLSCHCNPSLACARAEPPATRSALYY